MVGGIASTISHVFLVVSIPLVGVGFVGEDWRHEMTGPQTTVTYVAVDPPGIVNASYANTHFRGIPIGGYAWKCEAEGQATIHVNVFVNIVAREPTLAHAVTCLPPP